MSMEYHECNCCSSILPHDRWTTAFQTFCIIVGDLMFRYTGCTSFRKEERGNAMRKRRESFICFLFFFAVGEQEEEKHEGRSEDGRLWLVRWSEAQVAECC